MSASQRTKRSDLWRVKKEEMSSGERGETSTSWRHTGRRYIVGGGVGGELGEDVFVVECVRQ